MPLIIPANTISGEYEVANSLRFDDGSSDYLNKTPASAGNRKTWTWSSWVKLSDETTNPIFGCYPASDTFQNDIAVYSSNSLRVSLTNNGTAYQGNLTTNQVFRDFSAWYHIVVAIDTTQATSSDRMKLYINGSQVTSFSTETYPSQNYESYYNSTIPHNIGLRQRYAEYFNGYIAEAVFIDGQALTPTSFGEFDEDTGIWKPIDVSGLTFGTNGFYLDFENSGSLGADVSGNGNNFTVNNLTSVDQSTDTPTNNFATYNPLMNKSSGVPTMSNGNLTLTTNSEEFGSVSSIGVNQGKWYCELKWDSGLYAHIGITGDPITLSSNSTAYAGITADSWGWNYGGSVQNNNSIIATYSSFATSDILGIALDLDNNKLYFSKNGTWQNSADPSAGTNGISITGASSVDEGNYFIFIGNGSSAGNATLSANFGNPPFTISSGNSDANGYGNFEYAVPNSYFCLNSKNLAEYG